MMRHAAKRGIVVVAGSPNADMKAGTLSQVRKQAGLKDRTGSVKMARTEYLVIVERYEDGACMGPMCRSFPA